MTRAYLRLDPAYDEHKESYPDGPYAALIACFCQGEHQPERGRFRNERYLRAILGPRGRHVTYLIQHGDLVRLDDGRLYIEGWDEWQEGDWKVGERVARIRSRPRPTGGTSVTVDVTPRVTVDVTPRVTADRLSVSAGGAEALAEQPARHDEWNEPEAEAIAWLARHGCALSETNGLRRKLIGHVERSGVNAVVGAFDRLAEAGVADGDARRFVFGLDDLLFPKPDMKALEREERADEAQRASDARYHSTMRMLAQQERQRGGPA